jgi:hypothetical protein
VGGRQGCQIFLDTIYIQKWGYFNELSQHIPNFHEINQMAKRRKRYQKFSVQRDSKMYQNLGFGLKTNHLATLEEGREEKRHSW